MHQESGRALAAHQTKIKESSVVIGATAILVLAGLWCSSTYDLPDCVHHMRQSIRICTVFIAVLAVVPARLEQGQLKMTCAPEVIDGSMPEGVSGGWQSVPGAAFAAHIS